MLVTANVVPSSPILVTLIIVAIRSSDTSVLTRTTLRDILEDGIIHSQRRDNLKSYNADILLQRKESTSDIIYILTTCYNIKMYLPEVGCELDFGGFE
jgi:hypothetical protein